MFTECTKVDYCCPGDYPKRSPYNVPTSLIVRLGIMSHARIPVGFPWHLCSENWYTLTAILFEPARRAKIDSVYFLCAYIFFLRFAAS